MLKGTVGKRISARLLSLLLCLGILCSFPFAGAEGTSAGAGLVTETPVLIVTGDGVISGGVYSDANVSFERSYTLDELKDIADNDTEASVDNQYVFSTLNTSESRRYYRGEGVRLEALMDLSSVDTSASKIAVSAPDGFTVAFDPAKDPAKVGVNEDTRVSMALSEDRYYYPNINQEPVNENGAVEVPSLVTWASADERTVSNGPPVAANDDGGKVRTMAGQLTLNDYNNPLFQSAADYLTVTADNALSAVITVDGQAYTRAQILTMPRAERSYTYTTKGGEKTDIVRGVPLSELLSGLDDSQVINFHAADDFPVDATGKTKAELVAENAILAYEIFDSDSGTWEGIYSTAKDNSSIFGVFSLCLDDSSPAKMIDNISATSYADSEYKHITYTEPGNNYNIDALTSATLTVEGPGVEVSVPLSVAELERTADANIHRGAYDDTRSAVDTTRVYEGVKVLSILDGRINTQIKCLDGQNVEIVFKNRWRQEIGRMSYDDVKNATTPVIIAYGTALEDETKISPFIFTNATGRDADLGNEDGPLKLVFDLDEFSGNSSFSNYLEFSSVAYLYIEEEAGAPGFKHTGAEESYYSDKLNTEYLLTFTGSALGREVNYTVKELEDMVSYDQHDAPVSGGIGHRDEYSLSNTTYWYVNEYEGLKLWDLLTTKMGLDAAAYEDDDATLVSFSSWDNYLLNTKFSMKQLAEPDLFYYYEKSPLDIGTDRPTKEQLATQEYQPDNQVGFNDTDGNGYPVKKGYPVMLAYGVNGYPYVRSSSLEGFKSGLGNDGGPMRLIYGKTDGLNRENPGALENYAYFFNNGSNQLQRVQEVYVGDDTRYSTHLENPAYQGMKDDTALTVEVVSGGVTTPHSFTLAELESILYGDDVTKRDRDTQGRQEKGYYFHKSGIDDLFEGVNLEYLLTEKIGLQGTLGTVELYNKEEDLAATYELSSIGEKGYNSMRGTGDLGMMVAFAKNGYPLVDDRDVASGYVSSDSVTGKNIKNNGGPLVFVRGQTEDEKTAGSVDTSTGRKTIVENLTKIVVNLDPDVYAHVESPYNSYAADTIDFTGAVSQETGVTHSVGELETKQKYMVTDSYTVGGDTKTYRGLDLNRLLNDSSIGASALMSEIIVKNADGVEKTLTVADLTAGGKKIILAYGIARGADPTDAKPLVPEAASAGYEVDYLNSGGPMRLIIDGGTAADCVTSVTEIEVIKANVTGWKHDFGLFTQYADSTVEISGMNLVHNKTYTVAQLEAMENIFVADTYKMGDNLFIHGINLYQLLQNIGFASGDSSAFTAIASDGYSVSFTATDLKNGVNGKPILVAYGQGTSAVTGLPLVPDENSPGYDPNVGNAFGPLRLVIHDNSGWSVKNLSKIVVGAAGGNPDPGDTKDFNVYGLPSGETGFSLSELKSLTERSEDYNYTSSSQSRTDSVKGVYLSDVLESIGVSVNATVTLNTTDGYTKGNYENISMSDIKDKNYLVAYELGGSAIADTDNNSVTATVRIYRNHDDGSSGDNRIRNVKGVTVADSGYSLSFSSYFTGSDGFPNSGVRSIAHDGTGDLWIGTYGGGLAYLPGGASGFVVYDTTSSPPLATDFVSAAAADKDGGVWFSQNANYTNPGGSQGVGYMKDGAVTYFKSSDIPATIPDNNVGAIEIDSAGNVWFGSYGGLTRYNPSNGSWKTWTKADGLPAASVNTIVFDKSGGVWLGCYPDGTGTQEDPFIGGYAHLNASGTVDFEKKYTAPHDPVAGGLLADAWVRGMTLDNDGGLWVVRSGSYANLPNVGGRVDYVKNGTVISFTGKELLGEALSVTASNNPEIRNVAVDKNGGIWFGTSGAGLFYSGKPGYVNKVYSSGGGLPQSGAKGMDNIYYLVFLGDTLYLGTSEGVAWADLELSVTPPPAPNPGGNHIGDADADTAEIRITGAVQKPGYFTLEGLKTASNGYVKNVNYGWRNAFGTTGIDAMTGIFLQDLLNNVMSLSAGAKSVTITASDGYYRQFNIDSGELGVNWTDADGNKLMLAWMQNGSDCSPKLVVGRIDATHVNRPMWVSDVVSITVNAATVAPGGGTPGNYEPEEPEEPDPEEPPPPDSTQNMTPEINVEDGKISATNTAQDVKQALDEINESAQEGANKTLVADATTQEGTTKTSYTLPSDALQLLTGDGGTGLELKTNQGSVVLSPEILALLDDGSGQPVSIDLEQVIDEESGDLITVNITIKRGDSEVSSFNGNLLKADIPVNPGEEMQDDGLIVYYIDDDGNKTVVKLSSYDKDSQKVRTGLRHLSTYAVGYNLISFPDIKGHWGQPGIEFLASRYIVNGRSANAFVPDGSVTRAEFVKMLAESLDGIDISGAASAGFSDVPRGEWFTDYINWAAGLGIVQGYPDGSFRPNSLINREQMSAIAARFITATNSKLRIIQKARQFTDDGEISSYAKNDVKTLCQYGILDGMPDGSFNPAGTATRAQAAKIVKTFIEAVLK